MKPVIQFGLVAAAALAALPAAARAPAEARESVAAPVIVELFTSQGCPLCPEANALLAELDAEEGVLGLSLSVNIMDALGWRDTLAQEPLTARQEAYCDSLNVRFAYTPQIVVAGRDDARGSRPRAVRRLIDRHQSQRAEPADEARAEPAVAVTWSDGGLEVRLASPAAGDGAEGGDGEVSAPDAEALDVWLLAYTPGEHVVQVKGGDNAGKRMRIHNAVVDVQHLGVWSGLTTAFEADAPLTPAAVVLVQAAGHGPIVTARTAFAPDAS